MEKGSIRIENSIVTVEYGAGTVWLTEFEIADLFGVFRSKIGSNIRVILSSGILDRDKVVLNYQSPTGNIIPFYNLEMITALAFRIHSERADVFKHWIVKPHTIRTVVYDLPKADGMLN